MLRGISAYKNNENINLREEKKTIRDEFTSNTKSSRKNIISSGTSFTKDRLSLSENLKSLRLKEELGLPLEGKVTKKIFEDNYNQLEEKISNKIEGLKEELNIGKEMEVRLELREDEEIRVKSRAGMAKDFEERLKNEEGFKEELKSFQKYRELKKLIGDIGEDKIFAREREESSAGDFLKRQGIERYLSQKEDKDEPLLMLAKKISNEGPSSIFLRF